MRKILVIDDNPGVTEALALLFSVYNIEVLVAHTPQTGLAILEQHTDILLIIQDMNFTQDTNSGEEGKKLFYAIQKINDAIPVILITAWAQLEIVVELVRSGAADYIEKPWRDEKLTKQVLNLIELSELQLQQFRQSHSLVKNKQSLQKNADLCGCIYHSQLMQNLLDVAVKVAPADVPVLITGPNGSGKEKIAEVIQANSRQKNESFIKVNIGALPSDLIEAELFGAEAGAYTGANKMRIGRFEAADGGTLFLDEIGNLSLNGQMKLLRVLQTGEYERLGSHQTRRCQVRVISATNSDLEAAITKGEFREDLFFRLNVIHLKVPALTERKEDILPLLYRFLGNERQCSEQVAQQLIQYNWPGNVRELANACQRAILLNSDKSIPFEAFGISLNDQENSISSLVTEPSKELIEYVLKQNRGVIAQTARQLGLSRQSLYRRMEKFGIQSPINLS